MTTTKTLYLSTICAAAVICAWGAMPAVAGEIKYLSDPVYEKMAAEDPHPMEDLLLLGDEGDSRAQFILGDLYGKGKGGLPRNIGKARDWFEKSARGGYVQSFIRLAALEKRVNKPEDAYKWYTLAIDTLPSGEKKWAQNAREELVKAQALTPDQIKAAKKAAQEWKKATLEAEKAARAAREQKAKEDAAKAKAEQENVEKKADKKTDASGVAPAPAVEPAAGETPAADSAATAPADMPAAEAAATPAVEIPVETPAADLTPAPTDTISTENKGAQ